MKRSRRLVLALCAALVIGGTVLAVITAGVAEIVGGFLVGLAVILATGWVFYEIGIGEDRDRERGRA